METISVQVNYFVITGNYHALSLCMQEDENDNIYFEWWEYNMNFSNVLDLVCVLLHELACKSIWFFQRSFYQKNQMLT